MIKPRTAAQALSVASTLGFLQVACDNDKPPASPPQPVAPPASASADRQPPPREKAVALNLPGLPNAYRVSRDLYRGAQPEPEGFRALERLGVKTVVNLRLVHSDRDEIEQSGVGKDAFQYEHIRMEAWDADENEIVEVLRIVTDKTKAPVFIHCQHGADRTGTIVAAYRIVVQGWSKEEAISEMRDGPFGFHEIWTGLPKFLKEMDVERLRSKVEGSGPRQ